MYTDILCVNRKMPDVETIMEPWMGGSDQKNKDMPDFENADLLTLIDEVCGTCINFFFTNYRKKNVLVIIIHVV